MHHGRVLQHAPALDVYHRPASVTAARVVSDPPMNLLDGQVAGGALTLSGGLKIALDAHPHLRGLADGAYRFGIRASDCRLAPVHGDEVAVDGKVELSEISGSETFVYLKAKGGGKGGKGGDDGAAPLIVQQDGVYHHGLEEQLTIYLDPRRLLAFSTAGAQPLVASYQAVASPAAPAQGA